MSGVSARIVRVLFESARGLGLPLERLTEGLSESSNLLIDSHQDLEWSDFTRFLVNLEREVGGPEGLRAFGAASISAPSFRLYKRIGRLIAHPRDLYWVGARFLGPSLFPMVHGEVWELEEGRLVERLTLREGYQDCPQFFHAMAGCLATGPLVVGHGESKVDVRIEEKRATYLISTDARSHGWIGRFLRAIKAPFTMPAMLHELVSQQTEIEDGYTRLFEAHARIEVQAAELEQINRMGQSLAKQIDLHRAADLLVKMMLEELRFEGVELWLIRPSTEPGPHGEKPRFFRRGGEQAGPPSSIHLLETASRPVGSLKFWVDPTSDARSNEALLERLLPWIAMALDNARTYESLERHAADLEHRVKERTARLLAANHHLVKEIEERRRATEALMESEVQLRGAERLASIGTLAAGIAHEINNPIGSILAAAQLAQLIQSERDPAPEISQALEDIIGQAKRCGGIVRSILQFSRDERTEKWDCQLTDIAVRSIRLATAFAEEHGARMNIEIPATESWAHVNPIQVEQAIVNLLRNAIESGGRTIDVVLAPNPETARVAIEIRDDGAGIPESEQHRILEPFYTTRRPVGGTGLGLSVVHGIAMEHGGGLRIESRPNGGTIATLELPTVPPKLAPSSRSEAGPLEDKPAEDSTLLEES